MKRTSNINKLFFLLFFTSVFSSCKTVDCCCKQFTENIIENTSYRHDTYLALYSSSNCKESDIYLYLNYEFRDKYLNDFDDSQSFLDSLEHILNQNYYSYIENDSAHRIDRAEFLKISSNSPEDVFKQYFKPWGNIFIEKDSIPEKELKAAVAYLVLNKTIITSKDQSNYEIEDPPGSEFFNAIKKYDLDE